NKRLGDVLAYIKERQEQLPAPKVRTNSEKNGYTPRGRNPVQPVRSGACLSASGHAECRISK
ncbi:hypothetical protein ACCS93_34040, partial [Rhizobium ruizarguesonis]